MGRMKKLISKTTNSYLVLVLIVLLVSVPVYYFAVDTIWINELDENNEIIADKTEAKLDKLQLSETELEKSITLWNKIQPNTNLLKADRNDIHPDSIYTVLRKNPYVAGEEIDRFRGLKKVIYINQEPYYLTVETNVEEIEETVVVIAVITLVFFLILVIGFLFLNRHLSVKLWEPFHNTLNKLKTFNLDDQTIIAFEKSNTLEFEELNNALSKLLEHNISVYKTQKEFTENASHELQTPLAIIKNKLDLLLQKETVTDRQYQIIEEINKALTRISRINKNLLLLAKIENRQFDDSESINISLLTRQCLDQLREYSDNKNISIQTELENSIIIEGNKTLIEILINNLLLNAIRHNQENGMIRISLGKNGLIVSNSGNTPLNNLKAFKRFAKTSNESSGSGLGLAIIEQVCNCHKWNVLYRFENNFHIFSVKF